MLRLKHASINPAHIEKVSISGINVSILMVSETVNTNDSDDRKKKQKVFRQKYGNPGSDHWSGETRKNKITQGLNKQSKEYRAQVSNVQDLIGYLNEHVHGNIVVEFHWDFNKHGRFNREQIVAGFLNISIFYFLFKAYCRFTGRGGEINQFEWYETHVNPIFLRN